MKHTVNQVGDDTTVGPSAVWLVWTFVAGPDWWCTVISLWALRSGVAQYWWQDQCTYKVILSDFKKFAPFHVICVWRKGSTIPFLCAIYVGLTIIGSRKGILGVFQLNWAHGTCLETTITTIKVNNSATYEVIFLRSVGTLCFCQAAWSLYKQINLRHQNKYLSSNFHEMVGDLVNTRVVLIANTAEFGLKSLCQI